MAKCRRHRGKGRGRNIARGARRDSIFRKSITQVACSPPVSRRLLSPVVAAIKKTEPIASTSRATVAMDCSDTSCNANQAILNHCQTGTRPALSMSHPVCYSAACVVGMDTIITPDDRHNANDMVNGQRILEGRLVTPGAEHSSTSSSSSSSQSSASLSLPSSSSSLSSSANSSSNLSSSSSNQHPCLEQQQQQQHQQQQPQAQVPTLSPEEYFSKLHEALSLEPKFQPSLYLPQESQVSQIFLYLIDVFLLRNFHNLLHG